MKPFIPPAAFLFTLLFSTQFLLAQKQFPGYYVDIKGDTVYGNVEYKQWEYNPAGILFTNSAGTITLKPQQVKVLHVTGYDTYVSYSGPRLMNSVSYNNTLTIGDSASVYTNVEAFLRLLYNDKEVRLFEFKDNNRLNFFYQVNQGPIIELLYKVYYQDNALKSVPVFQQQLLVLFTSTIFEKKLKARLDKLQYEEKDLISFFQKLNNTGKPAKLYPTQWVVSGGLSYNSIGTGSNIPPVMQAAYNQSISPVLVLSSISYNQRSFGKLFISPQLRFYNYRNSGNSTASYEPGKTTVSSGIIINPGLSLGYNLINSSPIKWNVSLGGGIWFSPFEKITLDINGIIDDVYYTKRSPKYNLNIQTGIITQQGLSIAASFNPGTDVSYFYGKHKNVQLTGGWVFKL